MSKNYNKPSSSHSDRTGTKIGPIKKLGCRSALVVEKEGAMSTVAISNGGDHRNDYTVSHNVVPFPAEW